MSNTPNVCERKCTCSEMVHNTKLIVVTGGPGAGKTAVLEMARKVLCEHVAVLPEAASIVFGGGFWRLPSKTGKLASQRAIFHIQEEMEKLVIDEQKWAVGLCDRGTLDGLAYWPESESSFWNISSTTREAEFEKYEAIIHLRAPGEQMGYNNSNPLRVENAAEARVIDEKIALAWAGHSNYHVVHSANDFITKAEQALSLISRFTPKCCKERLSLGEHEKS